ncbi:MAG: proline--tRNA ligase [Nitrososphaerota archaeon]
MATEGRKFKNFTEWFDELLLNSRIADPRYPVKGFIVYLENGKYVMECVRRKLEEKLEKDGHKPMLFPIVATEENFSKEAEHIKGFRQEVFSITRGEEGSSLILRPTSETIIYPMFSIWIKSYADLPFKVHQSCEIYRYETKATRPLLRVREIPWNEAHTVHESPEDAERQFKTAIRIYSEVLEELGIAFLLLKRPDFDKFAGADYSVAFDTWNPDGKVNQVATVHNLGTNFSRVFEILFERRDGGKEYGWQLCYGMGYSRVLAAIIAHHGDDVGPCFPPEVAPIQVVIVPIPFKGNEEEVINYSREILNKVREKYRVILDDRKDVTPGEKFYHWERMGVPIRLEVGPKEVASQTITLMRRDLRERLTVKIEELEKTINKIIVEMPKIFLAKSRQILGKMIIDSYTLEEAAEAIENKKIVRACWCGNIECADFIKTRVGGEIRGYRYDIHEEPFSNCVSCRKNSRYVIYIARAY